MINDKNIRKGITATLFAVIMMLSVLAVVPVVSAMVMVYPDNRPGWEGAVSCYEEEFFTDASLNPGVSVVTDLGYVNTGNEVWWDNLICSNDPAGPTTTTWQFATPLVGFGGDWNPNVPSGPGSRIAVAAYLSGSWVNIGEIPETYEDQFWGFVSTVPFDAVRLSSGSLCSGTTWCEKYELDNMVYSAQDTIPPVITLNGAAVMTLECGVDTYTEPGATASDNCCIIDSVSIGGDIVDTSIVGTYTVTYDVTDCSGNPAAQVTRTVIVEDTTAPVITLDGAAVMTLECGVDTYTEPGATASDDCCIIDSVSIGGDTVDASTVGIYMVTYDVDDCNGNSAVQVTRTVNVVDTTPPEITVTVSPDTLWPPNHKMVDITATVTVSDFCDADPTVVLTSITSDEPDNAIGEGDGNTINDIQLGTDDRAFQLRAERAGTGDGRVYTITYTVTDASGNSADESATVVVPHDMD